MSRRTEADAIEARGTRDLLVSLDLRRGHLRRSLRESIRSAIQDGLLAPMTRLPSSRQLAEDLGVSRGVVSDTYDQLHAEGYLTISPRSAPWVARVAEAPAGTGADKSKPRWRFDFTATSPELDSFPATAWARAVTRGLREASVDALDYGDHRGRPELRRELAAYLARVRGVRTEADRIVITQGVTQALDLLCRMIFRRGLRTIGFETPSLPDQWETARSSGLNVRGISVDASGLVTEALADVSVSAMVVTPAHQFPTGAVMSPGRRAALLGWANRNDAVLIEDDYDAEFRYDRMPIGAIQGLDPGRVAHVGTVSKTLAPGVRLGWLSLPPTWLEEIVSLKRSTDSGSPSVDQIALSWLMQSGEYERHVGRMRSIYRRRRDRLMSCIAERMPGAVVDGAAAGLHVLLRLPEAVDDAQIALDGAASGVGVRPLSSFHLDASEQRGLLLGYGRLHDAAVAPAVDALAATLARAGVNLARRAAG
jgi:GntR family transcriptional regulator/MocR family aminotransferase